jgi:hypothetical protein
MNEMLELAKKLLDNGYDAHKIMEILVNGGIDSLEAAQILVEALKVPKIVGKIKMTEIEIEWNEYGGDVKDCEGFKCAAWDIFNAKLIGIARQHDIDGYTGSYCKTGFIVRYEDGHEYTGRLDVNTKHDTNVGEHMLAVQRFNTGEHCPDHMTQEQYEEHFFYLTDEVRQEAKDFLAKYEIVV